MYQIRLKGTKIRLEQSKCTFKPDLMFNVPNHRNFEIEGTISQITKP